MKETSYRPEIDGLRSIAVLPVLFFHVGFAWMPGGFVGVDVFFVISGYLITRLIFSEVDKTGTLNFSRFYLRRVRRLAPAMLATIALSFVAAYLIAPPQMMAEFAGSAIAAILSASNFYFWYQSGYFDTANELKPLLHTWSLAVEEQFYLVWPLILILAAKRSRTAAGVVLALIAAASLTASIIWIDDRASIYYLLPFRAFELAIGGLILWVERYRLPVLALELAFLAGLLLIGVAVFGYSKDTVFPSYMALVPCLGAALVIYAGRTVYLGALLDNPLTIGIGLISYSLYLVHWPLFVFYKYRFTAFDGPTLAEKWALCGATLLLAAAMYFAVERPLRTERPRSWLRGWRFGAAAAAIAALLAFPSVSAWKDQGWLWRYSPEIAALMTSAKAHADAPAFPRNCFMTPNIDSGSVDPSCYTTKIDGRPNIILLGDSTVAHLMDGLYGRLSGKANFYMWAASVCPSIPSFQAKNNPKCAEITSKFYEKILLENNYDIAIMASHTQWSDVIRQFPRAVSALKARGVDIVLIGQTLSFREPVANLVARHGRAEGLDDYLASAAWLGCNNERGLDKLVPPDHFFSMQKALCREGRPVAYQGQTLLFADNAHLNQVGSLYVADQLIQWMLDKSILKERTLAKGS